MKKMNKITATRIVSVLLCSAIVSAALGFYTPRAKAQSLSSLKDDYSTLEDKVSASEDKIDELESQQAEQEKIVDALNEQIGQLNDELENITGQKNIITGDITATEQKITELNNEIASLDAQIAQKNTEIDETVQLFCERMKANYMAGETSMLEIFTSSSDIGSFLNRLELFKRVTENDQDLVNQLNNEITSIQSMQKELEDKKTTLQTQKSELENKRSDLQTAENELTEKQAEIKTKSDEVNKKLSALNYQTQQLQVSVDEYNKEMDKIDAEITAYLKAQAAANKNQSSSSSGSSSSSAGSASSNVTSQGWQWPIPYSSSYISSGYGYRSDPATGSYKYHSGIDITMGGAYGKKIVATRSGRVLNVVYGSTGYGIYVMIDHGDGYVSLYGHCSSIAVSTGQSVSQGQVIAYIGSSGYSTGPHCHFEIRYGGDKVNPLNYVSK